MLLYKSWLDTRWRFLIGLAVLVVAACGIVLSYGELQQLLETVGSAKAPGGALGEAIEEAIAVQATFRGFVWYQWFQQNFTNLATLFAALLGSGSALSGSGRGLLFTLALPVSRGRWLGARAVTGLAELLALALLPSLVIALLSPLVGEHYAVGDALVHGICVFIVGSVFFGTAALLSTMFNDVWRPLLLTCLVAIVAAAAEQILVADGLFAVMSAKSYFLGGSLPWVGLLVSVLLTLTLLYAAVANVARRDF